MINNNPNYGLRVISRAEYNSHFQERVPTPALEEGVDYTLALLFHGVDPEALTILSRVQFGEQAKGALAIYLYFTEKGPCPGTISDDGIWSPDSRVPLWFNDTEGEPQYALQGYCMPTQPDTSDLALTAFTELTDYLSK